MRIARACLKETHFSYTRLVRVRELCVSVSPAVAHLEETSCSFDSQCISGRNRKWFTRSRLHPGVLPVIFLLLRLFFSGIVFRVDCSLHPLNFSPPSPASLPPSPSFSFIINKAISLKKISCNFFTFSVRAGGTVGNFRFTARSREIFQDFTSFFSLPKPPRLFFEIPFNISAFLCLTVIHPYKRAEIAEVAEVSNKHAIVIWRLFTVSRRVVNPAFSFCGSNGPCSV